MLVRLTLKCTGNIMTVQCAMCIVTHTLIKKRHVEQKDMIMRQTHPLLRWNKIEREGNKIYDVINYII
jgi:hypothetical protein